MKYKNQNNQSPGLFSSLPKDPIILVDTPPPPKADGGTQDSDSGKCGLLSPFAAIQNIGVSYFATKLPITSTVIGPGSRSWRGVTGGEQPPAHQELNTPDQSRKNLPHLSENTKKNANASLNMKKDPFQNKTLYINGEWLTASGENLKSINPSNGELLWEGTAASVDDIEKAIHSANEAFLKWSSLPIEKRQKYLFDFAQIVEDNKEDLARAISEEVGKPHWEALTEVQAVINKAAISVEAYEKYCHPFSGGPAITRFKPHGTVVVFGSYNFPAHIANGHIVPALLAGNTVVFKPSESTPSSAQKMVELWDKSGLPAGVLNLIQCEREVAKTLVTHPKINGIFFTGSVAAGLFMNKACADQPQKILALEMGGNNPLVVHEVKNLKAASYLTIQSAYLTSGQRCTCARRLIVPEGKPGDLFIEELIRQISLLKVGPVDERPEPFMGPVITEAVAKKLVNIQDALIDKGGQSLVKLKHLKPGTGLISPGLIDVTKIKKREDAEVFGPLLQCIRVKDFDSAIAEANNTEYGLTASIITDDKALHDAFYNKIRTGIINWNQQTTGASYSAPFGGIGLSGNHRPTAFSAAIYCSYPVASIELPEARLPEKLSPGCSI